MHEIRAVKKSDIPAMKEVLNSIDLFPAEYLDPMIADYFDNSDTEDIWFTATADGTPIALGYCAPEKFAGGTFNLYAIGVRKDLQGAGVGGKMMRYLENLLTDAGHRVLIVETSSAPELALSRKFYAGLGYEQKGVLPDFWSEGDDKVIFWKKLRG